QTGCVIDKPKSGRPKPVRTNENIAAVNESVENEPTTSISRRSQELGIYYGSLWRILHTDLHLHAYKIQLTQEFKKRDYLQRRNFARLIIERATDSLFSSEILFCDEAHFTIDRFVNKHNYRIWGDENPCVIHKKSLHPQKVTVMNHSDVSDVYFQQDGATCHITQQNSVFSRLKFRERVISRIADFNWPPRSCH
ncbi:hypothetical protein WN55_05513, partial [Dufourea novaeangliae]